MLRTNERVKNRMENVKLNDQIQLSVVPYDSWKGNKQFDLDYILYDLDSRLDMLAADADSVDYIIAAASGLVCSLLDNLFVGVLDITTSHQTAATMIDEFVMRSAAIQGCTDISDVSKAITFLEKKYPMASDKNTYDFGGGAYHHLKDFAHHPTLFGLACSLITQFRGDYVFGVGKEGSFTPVAFSETNEMLIGATIHDKLLFGTINWYFHLVSDVSGSSGTRRKGISEGTGIPGPILAMAYEAASLVPFGNKAFVMSFLSDLFSGKTELTGVRFDLRTEMGLGIELNSQALPVIANDTIVRTFYFIRRLASEIRKSNARSLDDMLNLDWAAIIPRKDNPTLTRMLTVATGVFTMADLTDAVVSGNYILSVNLVGAGRFAIAIGDEIAQGLKRRNIKQIRKMYEDISRNTFRNEDNRVYERIGADMDFNSDKLGLTLEQTEILYNIEQYKIINDINKSSFRSSLPLKTEWFGEWKGLMEQGFAAFTQVEGAQLHWLSMVELKSKIEANDPQKPWFRLVLLEAMLFEPYYALSLELDKKGNQIPSRKYAKLDIPGQGYRKYEGDNYLNTNFTGKYCPQDYVTRLRTCYEKCTRELNEVLKKMLTTVSITAAVALVTIAAAGALAPAIAVALVGSNFAGLSGAALTSACLAYLGGGAVAIGGAGMAGGTIAIVGGGAALGLGVGAGVGGAVGAAGIAGKKQTILQSAKLLVSIREIFLNDEHDLEFSNSVYEKYLENITEIEKGLVELRLKADTATGEEKKRLNAEIKRAEESVEAMKIARKNMLRFKSSFEEGVNTEKD